MAGRKPETATADKCAVYSSAAQTSSTTSALNIMRQIGQDPFERRDDLQYRMKSRIEGYLRGMPKRSPCARNKQNEVLIAMRAGKREVDIISCALSDTAGHRPPAIRRQTFSARAGDPPERTAGQTACPEECSARAGKVYGEPKGAGLAETTRVYIFWASSK